MEDNLWGAIIRIVVCLPIVAMLAYLLIKFGLARNYNRSKGYLKVLEQVELMPKSNLSVVRVGDAYLLLGATDKEVAVLGQLDDYQERSGSDYQLSLPQWDPKVKLAGLMQLPHTYLKRSKVQPAGGQEDSTDGWRDQDFKDTLQRLAKGSDRSA